VPVKSLLKRLLSTSQSLRVLDRSGRPRVIVLMYHDLCEDGDFTNWLRVPVSEFEAQLRMLGRVGRIVDAAACSDPESLPADRLHFLLTFDDGYVNNLRLALPVLERLEVPATFFISTGPMTDGAPFWSDMVTTAIAGADLRELDLGEFGLDRYRFRPGDGEAAWEDVQRCLVAIKAVGNEDHPAVAGVLDHLRRQYAQVLDEHLPRYRPLSSSEVATLAASPLVTIGSHGHHHRVLTLLDDEALAHSLTESRRLLEDIVGGPVRELAYPNGDHDERVRAAAVCAGYERAYTVAPGILGATDDPLLCPRLGVGGVGPRWLLGSLLGEQLLRDRLGRS